MTETRSPIVVGTDGSPRAGLAVTWAADEAARRGLPLHIVHAVERWAHDLALTSAPGITESLAEGGHTILTAAEHAVRERRPQLTVETRLVREATPFVLREQSKQAFEVVLGHRGLGGFASLLLGSTGLAVAGYAEGPVVIVRGEADASHGAVLVGLDLYADNTAMLEYAFGAASVRDADLRVMHAFRLAENLIAAGDIDDAERIERGQRTRMTEILAPWRARFPQIKVTEEIVREHPVIALATASKQADLLVVVARGHGTLQGAFLGSVSHGAIHHAHCPVAVIHQHV